MRLTKFIQSYYKKESFSDGIFIRNVIIVFTEVPEKLIDPLKYKFPHHLKVEHAYETFCNPL